MKKYLFIYPIILLLGFSYSKPRIDCWVLDYPKDQFFVCRLKNTDTLSYYIPNNAWLSNGGDTLYINAIYKRTKESDPIISYNQFNPPLMEEIKPDSFVVKKILYKTLSIKITRFIAIRVFDKPYQLDSINFEKYHSVDTFIEFEKKHSYLLTSSVYKFNRVKDW
jgi:hypothetical protein